MIAKLVPNLLLLAEVTEASPSRAMSECLSVFFTAGEVPVQCLVDPAVVSDRPADGHWQLLGVDESRRHAYYARIEHGVGFDCAAAGARVVGNATIRGDDS